MGWFSFWKRAESRRDIFAYWDGIKARTADPIVAYRALKDDPKFNLEVHPALIDAGDLEAIGITAAAVRAAFGVKPLEQGGLTEQECIVLLLDFFGWAAEKKNISSGPVTLPEPTDTTLQPSSTEPPMSSPADSSLIASEPN